MGCVLPSHAELPLEIEGLISDKGKWKSELGFSYANRQNNTAVAANPVTLDTGPTTSITLPTAIAQAQGNSDILVTTLGLRYGLTDKLEAYTRISGLSSESRLFVGGQDSRERRDYLAEVWLGINYQFWGDGEAPALLAYGEVAGFEYQSDTNARYKSFVVGLSTYHAIDPVVLSLSASYQINHARTDGELYRQPGNSFNLSPSLAFAANDRISFSFGTQWSLREPDRVDGALRNTRTSSTAWNMGLAYSHSLGNSFNLGFSSTVSGSPNATIRFNWVHSFAAERNQTGKGG